MDHINIYDPLSLVLFGLGCLISSIVLFEFICYLRRIVPKSVECWFCKYKTEVNYAVRNSWICPSCEQYNGFNEDGDYNKVIASQHNESLNLSPLAHQMSKYEWKKTASLCDKCNLKQQLKIKQLASFVPMSEKNYDTEVEHFRAQIEKTYGLCENCNSLVTQVLRNVREELSLPKRLYAAVSQVKIRGERAVYLNIFLSLVLAVSCLQGRVLLPSEFATYITQLKKTVYFSFNYPFLIKIFSYWVQLVIAMGFLVNSIGYYQTKSASIFLNSCSWVLMFFLTLYPAQYEEYINVLKVMSGSMSIVISIFIIIKNNEQKSKKKKPLGERKTAMPQMTSSIYQRANSFPNITRSPSSSNLSTSSFKPSPKFMKHFPSEESIKINNSARSTPKSKYSPIDEVQSNINFGISNLNLGPRYRKERKQQNSKPVITPPKFNPFSGTSRSSFMPNDKNYQWKPSTSFSYNQYEPSVAPSLYEGFEGHDPSVATITSFDCTHQYYPTCSPPTLAYYFSSPNFPKPSVTHSSTPINQDREIKNQNKWTAIHSLPVIFLIFCNIFLLCIVYNKETASPKT